MQRMTTILVVVLMIAVSCHQTANGYSYTTYYVEQDLCPGLRTFSNMGAISVKLTKFSTYRSNDNCVATFATAPGRRLMAKFKTMSIESGSTCSRDRLSLYDGSSTLSPALTGVFGLCGFSTPSRVYVTTGTSITLQFKSDSSFQYNGFTVILTDFRPSTCSNSTNFRCRNNRCIDNILTCDGWNNCGDDTDEIEGCGLSIGGVAGLAVGGIFLFVIFITLLVVCRRRRSRRYMALRETAARPTYSVTQTTYGTPQQGYQQQNAPAGAYQPPPAGAYQPPPAGAYQPPPAGAYQPPPAGAYPKL